MPIVFKNVGTAIGTWIALPRTGVKDRVKGGYIYIYSIRDFVNLFFSQSTRLIWVSMAGPQIIAHFRVLSPINSIASKWDGSHFVQFAFTFSTLTEVMPTDLRGLSRGRLKLVSGLCSDSKNNAPCHHA